MLVFTKQTFSFSPLHPLWESINICNQNPTTPPEEILYVCLYFHLF